MGQRGAEIVIRGKSTLHERAEFRVIETMPELWIARLRMGTDVNACSIGGGKLLRKYKRWPFVTGTNGTCGKSKREHCRQNGFAIKHCSAPLLRETFPILRETLSSSMSAVL